LGREFWLLPLFRAFLFLATAYYKNIHPTLSFWGTHLKYNFTFSIFLHLLNRFTALAQKLAYVSTFS